MRASRAIALAVVLVAPDLRSGDRQGSYGFRRGSSRPERTGSIGLHTFALLVALLLAIGRTIQPERIAVSHSNVGRQAWPDHRQQQRCNENAHIARFS